jgi:hypothetical protein
MRIPKKVESLKESKDEESKKRVARLRCDEWMPLNIWWRGEKCGECLLT